MQVKPGTLKDWSRGHKYKGVIREGPAILWACEHAHATSRDAYACAVDEMLARGGA